METGQDFLGRIMLLKIAKWLDPDIEKKSRLWIGLLIGSIAFWYVAIVQFLFRIIIG